MQVFAVPRPACHQQMPLPPGTTHKGMPAHHRMIQQRE